MLLNQIQVPEHLDILVVLVVKRSPGKQQGANLYDVMGDG
jgi:hypothetical protein